jgi:hypothetical protein
MMAHMAATERRDHAASKTMKSDQMGNGLSLGNAVDGNTTPLTRCTPAAIHVALRLELNAAC